MTGLPQNCDTVSEKAARVHKFEKHPDPIHPDEVGGDWKACEMSICVGYQELFDEMYVTSEASRARASRRRAKRSGLQVATEDYL